MGEGNPCQKFQNPTSGTFFFQKFDQFRKLVKETEMENSYTASNFKVGSESGFPMNFIRHA